MDIQLIRDLVAKIEAGLIARSEGARGDYTEYFNDRKKLLGISEIQEHIPSFVKNSVDIEMAFSYMRSHASGSGSWSARREYVSLQFAKLREYLDGLHTKAFLLSNEQIMEISQPFIVAQLSRAKNLIGSDPASAITKAETVLASVCKFIANEEGVSMGKSESLTNLVSKVTRDILDLESQLGVRAFSGFSNQAQLVAEIRNRYSDAHPAPEPDDDLAEFAVTTAGQLSIFLLKRYERRMSIKT